MSMMPDVPQPAPVASAAPAPMPDARQVFPPPDAALATWELTRAFEKRMAVDHLNLVVRRGEFFGFLGPNGAVHAVEAYSACCVSKEPTAL